MRKPLHLAAVAGDSGAVSRFLSPGGRDLEREAELLAAAAPEGGWAAHVRQRLALGEREYRDRWRERGALALVLEALEEAADLGGWGVLAQQALDHMALAAQAHGLLAAAAVLLDDDRGAA